MPDWPLRLLEHLFSLCSKYASGIQNPDTEGMGTKHIQENLEEEELSVNIYDSKFLRFCGINDLNHNGLSSVFSFPR